MAYTPENNPYIPGDPYSYDLKWIVQQIKAWKDPEASAEYAAESAANALNYAERAEAAAASMIETYRTPQFYGAAGDGITDDTQAFTELFANCENIFIPEGEYIISDEIDLANNTTVICNGTILDKRTTNNTYLNYTGIFTAKNKSNIKISGVKLIGSGSMSTPPNYKSDFYFEDCSNIIIDKNSFRDSSSKYCILFMRSSKCLVMHNNIYNYGYMGIGNLNEGNEFYALYNNIQNATDTSTGNNYAIMLNGYDYSLVNDTYGGTGLYAIGNYCRDTTPIWEYIDAHGGTNIIISNNILDNSRCGIAAFTDATRHFFIRNSMISNNVINCGVSTATALAFSGENMQLCNNTIRNAYIALNGTYLTNSLIHDNDIYASYRGLTLSILTKVNVYNNTFDMQNGNWCIYVSNGECDTVFIHHNLFMNCDSGIRNPSSITSANKYISSDDNTYINITTLQYYSAINGVKPEFFTSTPSTTLNVPLFARVKNSNYNGSNTRCWIFNGSSWSAIS